MRGERGEQPLPPEAQFDNRETIELGGGSVEMIDVRPEREKSASPVVVAPGWGTTAETYREFILGLVEKGRRTIFVDAPHGIDVEEETGVDIANAELRKAAALLGSLEKKDIHDAEVVAHSEAGIWALIAAIQEPERIRDVILVNPAGMFRKESLPRLAVGYSRDVVGQTIRSIKDQSVRKRALSSLREGMGVVRQDPLQSFREVLAIANADIKDMIQEVRERGGNVFLMLSNKDKAFPSEKILKELELEDVDGVASFMEKEATHGEPYLNPKLSVGAIDQVLTQFEEKAQEGK